MEQFLLISSILLWLVVLFNLLLTFALIRKLRQVTANESEPFTKMVDVKIGEPAPPLVAETLTTGKNLTFNDFLGRTINFIFISPNCSACRESLPKYEAMIPKAKKDGIEVVLVSFADPTKTKNLINNYNLHSSTVITPEGGLFQTNYKIHGWPSFCLIDAKGIVRATGHMPGEYEEWKNLYDEWKKSEDLHKNSGGAEFISLTSQIRSGNITEERRIS